MDINIIHFEDRTLLFFLYTISLAKHRTKLALFTRQMLVKYAASRFASFISQKNNGNVFSGS